MSAPDQHPAAPEGDVSPLTEAEREALTGAISYARRYWRFGNEPETQESLTVLAATVDRHAARETDLRERLRTVEGERDAARGEHGGGWFWSQAEWSDWSNRLAELLPEEYDDDAAQESIIERALTDLRSRAESSEAALASLRAGIWRIGESIHGDEGVEHPEGCEGEPTCFACILADLRDLLAGDDR